MVEGARRRRVVLAALERGARAAGDDEGRLLRRGDAAMERAVHVLRVCCQAIRLMTWHKSICRRGKARF